MDNLASALDITRKFYGNPHLTLHKLYFEVVHKIITPRKERRTEANYLELSLMELLDTEVYLDFLILMIRQMHRVLIKDDK